MRSPDVLHLHRAERADGLVEALRALLAEPPADPFAPEVIAVPTRGMERWLTQRMSSGLGASPGRQDGVCANVQFPSPRRLASDAVAAASGIDPDADPWRPERVVWPLLDVLDGCLGEPWCERLAAHLGGAGADADPVRRARRFGAVRHVADLLDRYALHRPEMVRGWAAGEDPGAWQAELFRRLLERIPQPDPAARLADACARLRDEPGLLDLPPRLSLFGLTRLPAGRLHVLRALARHRDVHLFLLHPSPALWGRVAGVIRDQSRPVVRRREDPTRTLPRDRLLASWGRDARELQLVLQAAGPHADHHHEVRHPAGTLLARLQEHVRADRPAPADGDARPLLDPGDRSVEVHACHGRARQVEVVRDAVLHLLDEDPTLEPRDVIVMCPDIEAFAPLVQASFGAGQGAGGDGDAAEEGDLPPGDRPPDLRVRLADRSLRQTNPVLGAVAQLLDLAAQRLTASQVLDLAGREPVRRRFGLDDDDLARMEDLVAGSGIRWGLDAEHRGAFQLDRLATGTWRWGLDRVLLGVAMTEDDRRLFGGVLPLDDVDGEAIDLAGRLAELVDRLHAALRALQGPQPVATWAAALAEAADALTATAPGDAWQRAQLQRLLHDVVDEADAGRGVDLSLPEVRALLADRLQGRPTRANFRTGHLTICTLMPMRSVPHRVVCLLGLDEGVFPRKAPRDGDDLMLDDPRVGERDPRSEDRQLLLDALMAATDRLVVTYAGADERTNAPRPPAVPVGELLDAIDRTVRTGDPATPASARVVVTHPLQPFDPRNFAPGALVDGPAWSFDRVTLEGARALAGPRRDPPPFLAGPLAPADAGLVALEDVVRFTGHPVRAFLRQRLGISLGRAEEEPRDALPVELGGLERWDVGRRLLEARLAGVDRAAAVKAELHRGTLPPGLLGRPVVFEIEPVVEELVEAAEALVPGAGTAGSVDVRVALPDGRTLSGTVPGVAGDVVRAVIYSRVAPSHRLAAWVRLLALTAGRPGRPWTAVTLGRAPAGPNAARLTVARIGPLSPASALAHLDALLDLHARGLREPLPMACKASAAYAQAPGDRVAAAAGEWQSSWELAREDAEPEHVLVLGGVRPFEQLLAAPPAPDESGAAWEATEPTRFGRLARRLWDGLLAVEEVEHR